MTEKDDLEPIPFLGPPPDAPQESGGRVVTADSADPVDAVRAGASAVSTAPPFVPDAGEGQPRTPEEPVALEVAVPEAVAGPAAQDEPLANEEPEPGASAPVEPGLQARLDTIAAGLEGMDQLIRRDMRRDELSRQTFDALHAELQGYKEDFLARAQLPMLKAMIRLLDDIDDMIMRGGAIGPKDLAYLGDQVIDLLEDYGAEEIGTAAGAAVEGGRQKVLRTRPTASKDEHGVVAEALGRGWVAQGRVLKAQNIVAYTFQQVEVDPVSAEQAAAEPQAAPVTDVATGAAVPVAEAKPGAAAETASAALAATPVIGAEPDVSEPGAEDDVAGGTD